MRLFGLDALTLTLATLAIGALLAVLYLRKRPRERTLVPSLALWIGIAGAGRRGRAKAPRSLLSALLIAVLLLAALGDPRPAYEPSDFALLIERGIAMSARDVAGTRLAAAKRAAHARVDALRPGDRAQVLSFAAHASAHSALTDDRAALHAAIERVRASDAESDPRAAAGLVGSARVVLFGTADPLHAHEFTRIGSSARNVGITAFSARSYPLDRHHASCLITVANFGPHPERATLRISAGVPLHEETLVLAAGERQTRTLDDLPGRTLEASIELQEPDPLPEDDRARAVLAARPLRVQLVSAGDRFLEAALRLDPELALTRRERFEAGAFDVVIFDRTLPDEAPALPALYLGPPQQGGYFPLVRRATRTRPFFERIRATPLLAGLALRDVNIARAVATELGADDRALAAGADGTPLWIEGRRRAPFLALTFALAESDLALRAAFPVLIQRALEHLAGAPSAGETHVAGETFRLSAPQPTPEGTLPAGATFALDRAHEGPPSILAHAGTIAPHGSSKPATPRAAWYWPVLALAAALLLVLEYIAFRRGWTR